MRHLLNAIVLTSAALGCSMATAQAADPAAAAAAAVASPPSAGAIRSQNIFEVKPEASADPNELKQSNGERQRVQPGNNAPMWRQVSGGVTGFSSLPADQAPEAGNLIQGFVKYPGSLYTNAGEAWRQVRNNWIIPYGAALLFVVMLAISILYFTRGPIGLKGRETGRKIERFTPFERATHWSNAIAFVLLAFSGIVMAFGKFFLLPVLGTTLFGYLTYALKTAHNFIGPLFVVSTVFMVIAFLRDNLPRRNRFNGGEKFMFWAGVLLLGSFVIASGLFLDRLLSGFVYTRSEMQIAHMIHAVSALLLMGLMLGHIYLGTIGMKGAYRSMRDGYVDETWAKEHHPAWYDDVVLNESPRPWPSKVTAITPAAVAPAPVLQIERNH